MTIDKIRLKKLAEEATQGPWCWDKGEDPRPHTYGIATDADPECMVVNQDFGIEMKEDAYFIAAASPATVLALLAEIESTETRLHDVAVLCATVEQERDQLKAENEALRKDAKRYRFLPNQHWPVAELAVVCNPKVSVKLGHDCPSGDRLDQQVDGAMIRGASHD